MRIEQIERGVNCAANGAGAERADGFVNGDDAADFGGVHLLAGHFHLGIDHFDASGAELIDFGFAVEDERLAGLEAAFEIAAVKKFDGELAAGVANQHVKDGIASAHGANGLAAHDLHANGVDTVGLDVFYVGEMDAVFVAEGQVIQKVFEGEDAALGEQLGALGADAFDHADFGGESWRGHGGSSTRLRKFGNLLLSLYHLGECGAVSAGAAKLAWIWRVS